MTDWKKYSLQGVVGGKNIDATACNCIGPQDGAPVCPCAMRGMEIVNGRYQKVIDYGPAPSSPSRKVET